MTDEAEATAESSARTQPESLRLKALSAGLTVNDLTESTRWYCDVVGFHKQEEFEHEGQVLGVALVAGAHGLFLSQDDGAKGTDRVKSTAIRIFLTTSQDIDKVVAAIKERGGTLASAPEDMLWGGRAFNLVDPDGFLLTITT